MKKQIRVAVTLRDERHLKPTAGKLTHVWVLVVCIYVSNTFQKTTKK